MGLDISAYKNVKQVVTDIYNEDGEPLDPQTKEPMDYDVRVHINPDFMGRADDLVDSAYYVTGEECADGRWGYGRYNRLRDELAKLAGYPLGQYEQSGMKRESYSVACWDGSTGPFSELINFSDCEGVIGTAISKKLAADFAEFQEKADAHPDEEFREFYKTMRNCFDIATQNGFVSFH